MKFTHIAILFSVITLSACSKKPDNSFPELDAILNPTETKFEERTDNWYKEQEKIRTDVLRACFNYFDQKASELGGIYQAEFYDNLFSKYVEKPDCMHARQGEILAMESSGNLHYEHQIKEMSEQLYSPEGLEDVNKLAQDVANKIEEMEKANSAINNKGKAIIQEIIEQDE